MPSFSTDPGVRSPFGKNQYLRSTQDVKTESATFATTGIIVEVIDGHDQKVLQPGTLIAKITSGADAGKYGAFQTTATDGRQTAANVVGINDTFLPWQLLERDVEIAYAYDASVVQAWCFEYVDQGVYNGGAGGGIANGVTIRVPLTNATRDAILGNPGLRNLRFS